MRVRGRDYNTNAIEQSLKGIDSTLAVEKMIVPEVFIPIIYFQYYKMFME
jgi:hypothetical protein